MRHEKRPQAGASVDRRRTDEYGRPAVQLQVCEIIAVRKLKGLDGLNFRAVDQLAVRRNQ
jgi:hypothetical protein